MQVLILGAGQLARMMSLAGAPLDLNVWAYDVNTASVVHPLTQQVYSESLAQAIERSDVITAEFEHIPAEVLTPCQLSGKFLPGQAAIEVGGDRGLEKALLEKVGVANAPYHFIAKRGHLEAAAEVLGLPLVIKTCQAGYDGKGQWRLRDVSEIDAIWPEMVAFLVKDTNHRIVAEQMISFEREVSLIGVRDRAGNTAFYPMTENVHHEGVLAISIAGVVSEALQQQAQQAFERIASELNYVGVLAIEFFEVAGQLLVNELAPRVHNSGHWTQQGTLCSQFDNHLRAVAGLPLGSTLMIGPSAMVNVLGASSISPAVLSVAGVSSHWYGKAPRPGRKIGHINVVADTLPTLGDKLLQMSKHLLEVDARQVERAVAAILRR